MKCNEEIEYLDIEFEIHVNARSSNQLTLPILASVFIYALHWCFHFRPQVFKDIELFLFIDCVEPRTVMLIKE